MIKNSQDNTYTCYNIKYIPLSEYQDGILKSLISGKISCKKLAEMRSNARRYGNLDKSIELAIVNEIYKYEVKNVEREDLRDRCK
ncbi:hypothetical protein NVP1161O_214 [Vibrio phage 1.161.O._10N.261.48.C5]|nr:hypothetical protein NVP1161O_214 [Vibrio phage 1.161.O._10N.261.48.C5]